MKVHLLTLLLPLVFSGLVWGQTDGLKKIPFPGGVFPGNAPNYAKWTLTVTTQDSPKPAAGQGALANGSSNPKPADPGRTVVTVEKTLPIRCVTINSTGSGKTTVWCVDELQFQQEPANQNPTLFTGASLSYINFSVTDFPELSWISGRNFAGMRETDGRQLLVFQEKRAALAGSIIPNRGDLREGQATGTSAPGLLEFEALVDAVTRLPVSMRKGRQNYAYKYEEPPVSILKLPANIADMLEVEKTRIQRLARTLPGR